MGAQISACRDLTIIAEILDVCKHRKIVSGCASGRTAADQALNTTRFQEAPSRLRVRKVNFKAQLPGNIDASGTWALPAQKRAR